MLLNFVSLAPVHFVLPVGRTQTRGRLCRPRCSCWNRSGRYSANQTPPRDIRLQNPARRQHKNCWIYFFQWGLMAYLLPACRRIRSTNTTSSGLSYCRKTWRTLRPLTR